MVDKGLIRPYFWRGYVRGLVESSHKQMKLLVLFVFLLQGWCVSVVVVVVGGGVWWWCVLLLSLSLSLSLSVSVLVVVVVVVVVVAGVVGVVVGVVVVVGGGGGVVVVVVVFDDHADDDVFVRAKLGILCSWLSVNPKKMMFTIGDVSWCWLYLREPQHTPRAYCMNPRTPKWKECTNINCWLGVWLMFQGYVGKKCIKGIRDPCKITLFILVSRNGRRVKLIKHFPWLLTMSRWEWRMELFNRKYNLGVSKNRGTPKWKVTWWK